MRRSRLTIFALGTLAPLAMFAACTFPDVGFGPPGSSEAGSSDTTSGDGPNDGAVSDVDFEKYDTPDAPITRDDAGKISEAGCGDPFDCDKDDDHNKTYDGGPDATIDCDDFDSRAKHDAGFRSDDGGPHGGGDWNCDLVTDKFYAINVTCSGLFEGDNCSLIKGFTGDPPCGEQGDYITCKKVFAGVACQVDTTEQKTQACK